MVSQELLRSQKRPAGLACGLARRLLVDPLATALAVNTGGTDEDDAAAVVLAAEARARPPRTYVVSDGHPAQRRECHRYLAELLGVGPPRLIDPSPNFLASHHSGNNKRVNNARMLAELNVRLLYPTYKEGVPTAVEASGGERRGDGVTR